MTPNEYREFITGVELESIYLVSSTLKRFHLPGSGATVTYRENHGKPTYEPADNGFRATVAYRFRFFEGDDEDPYASVTCQFAAAYTSEMPIDDDYFQVFRDVNLPTNLWPYVREHVHISMLKMGLPTVLLQTRKT